jgi:hypothetical protein
MNAVNRVVVVVLLLLVMVLCSVALAVPVRTLDAFAQQATAVADSIRQLGGRYELGWNTRVIVSGVLAAVLDLILVLLLIAEFRWPRPKSIRAEKAGGGEVKVSIASIADRVRHEVGQIPNVLRSKSKVSAGRGGVVVELDVETVAGVDVPGMAERIVGAVRQVVEESLGLKLTRPPKVNLRAVPYSRMVQVPSEPQEELAAVVTYTTSVPEAPKALEEELEEAPPALPEDYSEGD